MNENARPPAIFTTLRAGFDIVSAHPQITLFSILLDVFLWLGPKAQISLWLQRWLNEMAVAARQMQMPPEMLDEVLRAWTEVAPRLNLWAALRTFPVGVPGLMWLRMPETAPWSLAALELSQSGAILGILLTAVGLGWLLGGGYLWACARAAGIETPGLRFALQQSVLLMVFWQALLAALLLGSGFATGVLLLISPGLAEGGVLLFMLVALWLIPAAFFSPHAIFVDGETAFSALSAGWHFVRQGQPLVNFFFFDVILLAWLSVGIWNTPADDSWLLLVGIGGHAFVSAALTVASLLYYRDLRAWLAQVRQQQPRLQADGGSLDEQL